MRSLLDSQLIAGIGFTFLGKYLSVLAQLTINVLAARLLSASDFGIFVLFFAVISILGALVGLGLAESNVRLLPQFIASNRADRAKGIIYLTGGLAILSVLVASLVISAVPETGWQALFAEGHLVAPYATMALFWLAALVLNTLSSQVLLGLGRAKLAPFLFYSLPKLVALSLLLLGLAQGQIDLRSVLAVMAIGFAASAFIGSALCLVAATRFAGAATFERPTTLLKLSIPLMIAHLGTLLITWSGIWVFGVLAPLEDVAVLGAASQLVIGVSAALYVVNFAFRPNISALANTGDYERLEKLVRTLSAIVAIPNVVFAFIALFFGDWLMELLYGEKYADAGLVLFILSLGAALQSLWGPTEELLKMSGKHISVMNAKIISIPLLILGLFALTSFSGVYGAAFAMALHMSALSAAFGIIARRKLGIWSLITTKRDDISIAIRIRM